MGNAYTLTQKETKKAAPKDDAVQENILNGQKAVEQVIKSHSDVKGAMYRNGIGSIDFIWGKEGDASKEYRGGYGISHIVAHRNAQGFDGVAIAKKMPEVIMTGKITLDSPYKVSIETDRYKAVLAKNKNGTPSDPWLLTGFNKIDKTKEVSSERREGFDSSTPTADTPTQTRRTGADTSSTSIIIPKAEKGNKPDELRNQLSDGGKQAYDYALDKLSQGNEKVAQSAKESAFIYARMAERWSEIMHEYGSKTYSPEDYIKAHPIVMNQLAGEKGI